jgi:tetratricopeptide (TPR) repeat protein
MPGGEELMHVRSWIWMGCVALGAVGVPAAHAQAPTAAPTAAEDSVGLVEIAALHARDRAQALERQSVPRGHAPRAEAGEGAYTIGLTWLLGGRVDSALVLLRRAVQQSPNVARFHGDLAFGLAAAAQWPEAEEEYRAAVRLQEANPWYYVGLGAAQEAQGHWSQAAASFTLAVNADSSVIVRQLIGPAGDAYQNSGMRQPSADWARMATQRFPEEAAPWLRLASAQYTEHDTASGMQAIRHYRSLMPDDLTGKMLYAEYLLAEGQDDSAVVYARAGVADSTMQPIAASVFYNVGGHYLQHDQYPQAAQVLQEGRAVAAAQYYPQFDLFIGVARLRVLQNTYNQAVQANDCRTAGVVDTMLTSITTSITAGQTADSALANQVLQGMIPQYRQAIDRFKQQCAGRN